MQQSGSLFKESVSPDSLSLFFPKQLALVTLKEPYRPISIFFWNFGVELFDFEIDSRELIRGTIFGNCQQFEHGACFRKIVPLTVTGLQSFTINFTVFNLQQGDPYKVYGLMVS